MVSAGARGEATVTEVVAPFRIETTADDVDDLRERLRRTRWPENETVTDWSQGVAGLHLMPPLAPPDPATFGDLTERSSPHRGGHFAAFEQPESFVSEVRAFFRMVR
jgi:Epoxide hydrolase N terminus